MARSISWIPVQCMGDRQSHPDLCLHMPWRALVTWWHYSCPIYLLFLEDKARAADMAS